MPERLASVGGAAGWAAGEELSWAEAWTGRNPKDASAFSYLMQVLVPPIATTQHKEGGRQAGMVRDRAVRCPEP